MFGSWTWFEAAIIRGLKEDVGINGPDETARRIQGSSTRNTSDKAKPGDAALEGAFQVPNPWRSGSKVWYLQSNFTASSQEMLHEITWTDQDDPEKKEETTESLGRTGTGWGYGLVRELTPGDRIAIYARAQARVIGFSDLMPSLTSQYTFQGPGGVNHVGAVEVRMYYSV